MTDTLRSILPTLYHPFLPDFFDTPAPVESKATCASCAMCAPPGAAPDAGAYFRPDAKCCTYHPKLPNYLVGAILADERPEMQEGRRRVRAKIAARTGVTPRWLAPSRKTEVLLRAAWKNAFGRSQALLCPYFERESANCTIWRHREVVCTTFFCKFEGGADGERFWGRVRSLVGHVEGELSLAAARAVLPDYLDPPISEMTLAELEDRPTPDAEHAALWGAFAGREEELYLRAHEWARGLDRERFAATVMGPTYDERLAEAVAAHLTLTTSELPERLIPNPAMTAQPVEGGVRVTSYNRFEPLELTEALYEVVREFGAGETVAEVRARLLRDSGLDVPEDLLISLHRFRVLVAAPPS